ncbi:MAG: pilC [Gammaproteobacteria bacterium]|jgi:type IV pilus assembly protein PilC|nr:pilC [Gammaproteobacteria bacterium]
MSLLKKQSKEKEIRLITYVWSGLNKRGDKVSGEINAANVGVAKAELRRHQVSLRRIHKKHIAWFASRNKRITTGHIATFTRQLTVMLSAGIPLVTGLNLLGRGHRNPAMSVLLLRIKADIETGLTLSQALRHHPKFFNDLYCNLIESGEQSGYLETMLNRVATYCEKSESLKRKIKKALVYPAAIVIVAIAVTAVLLIFVVPQFSALFKDFGAELPWLTQLVVDMSGSLRRYWWIYTIVTGIGGWVFVSALQRSARFRAWVETQSLRLPIFGNILAKSCIARFSRTLAITVSAGMPLVDALESAAGATGNYVYRTALMKIRNDVSTGQQLGWSLKTVHIFPNMVVEMISIGEESGQVDEMLVKVADFFEEEVEMLVDSLSSLMEPIIMVILGILVGGLVVAMYMPIFELGSVIK